jgi:NDP-sugar pyrophosphorylase family protein
MSPDTTDVLILAGGLGTRLRPVVSDRPKVLALVRGEPYLHHLLRYVGEQGFRRVVLLVGYGADAVRTSVAGHFPGLTIDFSEEERPLGTGGAVRNALPLVRSSAFLVLNGDSFCAAEYSRLISTQESCLLVTRVDDTSRYGTVEVDFSHRVLAFREKQGFATSGLINAGVYGFCREHVELLPFGQPASLEKELLPLLAAQGLLLAVPGGRFIDIGTPHSYLDAQTFFSEVSDGVAV